MMVNSRQHRQGGPCQPSSPPRRAVSMLERSIERWPGRWRGQHRLLRSGAACAGCLLRLTVARGAAPPKNPRFCGILPGFSLIPHQSLSR